MRALPGPALALLLLAAAPAAAQDISAEIGSTGLAATESRLAALPSPSEADRFALGGIRFLRAVEATFQTRYRTGMSDPTGTIPFLRLDQGAAPDATFAPGDVAALFADAATGMAAAREPLADLATGPEFALTIRLGDVWFDATGAEPTEPRWASVTAQPGARLHLYGKALARRGRKMGHINCIGESFAEAQRRCAAVAQALGVEP